MDINKLEKLAKAATQGEWTPFVKRDTEAVLLGNDAEKSIVNWPGFDSAGTTKRERKANARYIAAAQPSVVLELIQRIRELESA